MQDARQRAEPSQPSLFLVGEDDYVLFSCFEEGLFEPGARPVSRGRAINQGPGVEDAPLIKKASLTPSQ
jgi:hypothetical protein